MKKQNIFYIEKYKLLFSTDIFSSFDDNNFDFIDFFLHNNFSILFLYWSRKHILPFLIKLFYIFWLLDSLSGRKGCRFYRIKLIDWENFNLKYFSDKVFNVIILLIYPNKKIKSFPSNLKFHPENLQYTVHRFLQVLYGYGIPMQLQ